MSESPGRVVLDACVLASYHVCDILLRLAESPSIYEPRWSDEIIVETVRTMETKLVWPARLARYFESEIRANFPEALVTGYQHWVPEMTNDPKDRHVVAAAVESDSRTIVTFNLRHFKPADLQPWNAVAIHPDHFLSGLFHLDPGLVRLKLIEKAAWRNRTLATELGFLRNRAPQFVDLIES